MKAAAGSPGDGEFEGQYPFGGSGEGAYDGEFARGEQDALGALFRGARPDADAAGERRAVEAFRAAREGGAHRKARTRRRDDWRPRGAVRRFAWRAALGTVLAGLTVGGVAVAVGGGSGGKSGAASGPSVSGPEAGGDSAVPTDPADASGPGEEPGGPSAPPGGPSVPPGSEQSERSLCRTLLEGQDRVDGSGKSVASASRRRLAEAAGGEGGVQDYCARVLKREGQDHDQGRGEPGVPGEPGDKSAKGQNGNGNG
ncbi:hypothetical protein ACIBI4_09250 [Streptomyces sp. NPDC050418]|uniref:hypothetical protein n=1 Tax=Streptomyces sp. NPDC050418 TaxID=3365612 RepID=UPI00379BFA88